MITHKTNIMKAYNDQFTSQVYREVQL